MDAFLAKRDKGENPVITILANIYYSLNYCYERNGKGLRFCTTLLYLWLVVHLFHSKGRTTCPIEDYHWSWVKTMSKAEWTKHLDEATEKSICWYPLEHASLTFEDPRLSANGEPHSSHAGPYGPLKQKLDDNLEHPSGQGANKKACRESWSRAVSQEKYIIEIEQDQALAEKEDLKEALAES
ncbi:hypothetical protein CR513_12351, partial [Mucuna pruriens]